MQYQTPDYLGELALIEASRWQREAFAETEMPVEENEDDTDTDA